MRRDPLPVPPMVLAPAVPAAAHPLGNFTINTNRRGSWLRPLVPLATAAFIVVAGLSLTVQGVTKI